MIGTISDAASQRYLNGAIVRLVNTDYQAATDSAGRYRIRNLPPGTYTVEFRYTGYRAERESVEVAAGETRIVDATLGEELIELEEFLVEGVVGSHARALNQQRSAQNLVSVMSSDAFGQLPDKTIADAVKRLPGITVEQDQGRGEARYVSIRGMNADFNAVSINGQRVMVGNFGGASRSVPLDVVSSSSAESIEVTKAVTPDMDGDGVGGAINIRTRSAFDYDGSFATIEGSIGYNELADGYGGNYPHDGEIYEASATYSQYLNDEKTLGMLLSANFRDRPILLQDVSLGNFVPITDTFVPELADVLIPGDLQIQDSFDNIENAGFTFNLDYRPSRDSSISFDASYSVRDTNYGSNRANMIYFPDIILEGDTADVVNNTLTDFVSDDRVRRQVRDFYETQEVLNLVLDGEQVLDALTVTWQVGWNQGDFEGDLDKDTSARFRTGFGDNGFMVDPSDGYFPRPGDRLANLDAADYDFEWVRRGTRLIYDDDYSGELNLRRDMNLFGLPGFLQGGVKLTQRDRDFQDISRRWENLDGDVIWTLESVELASTGEQIFGSVLADYGPVRIVDGRYDLGLYIDPARIRAAQEALLAAGRRDGVDYISRNEDRDEGRGRVNSYLSEENITAGYLMGQVRRDKLVILAGVRAEYTDVSFDGTRGDFFDLASLEAFSSSNDYTDVLPGVHLRYEFDEDSILRASVNSTLARASFFQLNPSADVDPFGGSTGNGVIVRGSTQLDPTQSWNFDLSYDRYFGAFGVFTAAVFYKNMSDNVYRITKTLNANDPEFAEFEAFGIAPGAELSEFRNAEGASIFGFEVAVEYPLDMLPGALQGLRLFGNFTYTDSEVDFAPGSVPGRGGMETPLFGQVPEKWNLGVIYDKYGFEARLAYSITDDHLLFNGIDENPALDRYAEKRERLDLSASYNINRNWKVFLEVQNMLDDPIRGYRGDPGVRMYYNEYTDLSAFFGVRWRLR